MSGIALPVTSQMSERRESEPRYALTILPGCPCVVQEPCPRSSAATPPPPSPPPWRCSRRATLRPAELRAKLTSRGFEAAAAQAAIEELKARGALNEARYAQNYVTWHAGRGQGPVRIGADLRRHGIPEDPDRVGPGRRVRTGRRWPASCVAPSSARRRRRAGARRRGRCGFCSIVAFHRIISARPLAPTPTGLKALEQTVLHERGGRAQRVPGILSRPESHHRALELARARQRPDAAVHQRRHGAVQGRVPRQGAARLPARRFQPALRARRGQAQRSGERGLHRAPPHLLRDARQLLLRRLLQARSHPFRLGLPHLHARPGSAAPVVHGLPRRRRGRRHLAERHRHQPAALLAPGRGIEFLGDGRHRPLRTVQRDLLRPRRGSARRPAGLGGRGGRPLRRDLEPRLHAVRARRRRQHAAAAASLGGHRHGARAHLRRSCRACIPTTTSTCSRT